MRWRLWSGLYAEQALILALAMIAAAIWGFIEIADAVVERETVAIDREILLLFRDRTNQADPLGPAWFEEMMRDLSALGGAAVLFVITSIVCGLLLLTRRRWSAAVLLTAVLGGSTSSMLLKIFFERPRPALVPHGSNVMTASFPSGHAMLAAATYLTLALMLARVESRRPVRLYLVGAGSALTIVVGVSRVYLGVHWPTDVVAGWLAGAVWALAVSAATRLLERSGIMKADATEDGARDEAGAGDPFEA